MIFAYLHPAYFMLIPTCWTTRSISNSEPEALWCSPVQHRDLHSDILHLVCNGLCIGYDHILWPSLWKHALSAVQFGFHSLQRKKVDTCLASQGWCLWLLGQLMAMSEPISWAGSRPLFWPLWLIWCPYDVHMMSIWFPYDFHMISWFLICSDRSNAWTPGSVELRLADPFWGCLGRGFALAPAPGVQTLTKSDWVRLREVKETDARQTWCLALDALGLTTGPSLLRTHSWLCPWLFLCFDVTISTLLQTPD